MTESTPSGLATPEGSFKSLVQVARVSWSLLTGNEKIRFAVRVLTRFALNGLDVIAVALMGIVGAITATGISGQQMTLFGVALPELTAANVIGLVALVALLFTIKGGLAILLQRWTTLFLAELEVKNSAKMLGYLLSGSLNRLRKYSKAELQFLVDKSTNATFSGVLGGLSTLIIEGTLFLGIFTMFVVVDWAAALAIAVYFAAVIFVLQLVTAKRFLRSGRNLQAAAVGTGSSVLEMVDIFREMFVLSKQDFYLSRFVESKKLSARTGVTLQVMKGLPRYVTETGIIFGALLFVIWQLQSGNLADALLSLGIFLGGSLRIMMSLLPLQLVWNEMRVMQKWVEMAQVELESVQSAPERFDFGLYSSSTPRRRERPSDGYDKPLGVEISTVSFFHTGNSVPTISEVSIVVQAGSTVAIVGPSGAGKTTLVDLMLGLYEPQEGRVRVEGLSPSEFRLRFPGSVAYVPQKPGLVSGSIAENVAIGFQGADIDEKRVWESLQKAQLASLVEGLPDRIHSSLGAHSDGLSGGQIQRLGLARALYSNPRLIVLDEATSALDAGTEASITEAIANLGSETTVVVIAHRLSTIQNAGQVHVMDDGRIVASGTFSEVRKKVPMIEEYVKLMSFDDD